MIMNKIKIATHDIYNEKAKIWDKAHQDNVLKNFINKKNITKIEETKKTNSKWTKVGGNST